jgi:DNA-binding CsgD family transcriptional regulator
MAQPKKLTATREELYEMYWGKQMSARQIAERFSISEEAVRRQMVKYGLPRRSRSEILKYARMSFGGDPLEGAYLIGLRAGDIHARRRATNTVGVNVTTTHPAMCELFEKTFGKYGHVRKYPVKGHLGYEWYLYCDLDKSFEFLIDKPIEVPSGDNLYAFLAAYVDCEGTWSFSKQVNKIVFHFWIKSQDKALLKQIKEKLEEEGLHPNHLKLVKKGQHRHEESENRNHVKIRYRRD